MRKLLANLKKSVLSRHPELRAIRQLFSKRIVAYNGNRSSNKKWALLSYLPSAINMKDTDPRMLGHSNWWEARELARLLSECGYNVESISCMDAEVVPQRKYDLILDIGRNLQRLAPFQSSTCRFLLLLTGSHHLWSIQSEANRITDFYQRHHVHYVPRYNLPLAAFNQSLRVAHRCLLIGNDVTLATYPNWAQGKIQKIPVTASVISYEKKYERLHQSFLYFNSARNIVKGLDLVLDVFLQHPEWKLHVVGNVLDEQDFWAAYPGISQRKNISLHGFLRPSSMEFAKILDDCDAFLAPSCSEGTSTAVLTCLCAGLYPLLNPHTGVDLPADTGVWFKGFSPDDIEYGIRMFHRKEIHTIADEATKIRSFTIQTHNREIFSRTLHDFFSTTA